MDKAKFLALSISAILAQTTQAGTMGPVSTINWTGPYLGGQIGAAWVDAPLSEETLVISPPRTGNGNNDATSFIGGVYGGYNWQTSFGLFGVEGDFTGMDAKKTSTCLRQDANVGNEAPGSCFSPGYHYGASMPWEGAVRARLGWIWNNTTLLYVGAGVTFTELKSTFSSDSAENYTPGNVLGSESSTTNYTGGTIGAGAEYRFMQNLIARIEYRYNDYGTQKHLITNGGFFWNNYYEVRSLSDNSLRLGVSYLFQ